MTDHQTLVESYADLASDVSLEGREPDIVADALNDLADTDHAVVVMDEWLVDEKDVEALPGATRVFVGEIEAETEKAVLLDQGQGDDWVPKSCSTVYQTQPGVTIDTPQTGLGSYATPDEGVSTDEVGGDV